MRVKTFIFWGLLGYAAYALQRAKPPVPPGATAADSAAVATASVGARFHYGLGAFGSKIVGRNVRGMVNSTEQTLHELAPAIKSAKGPDGMRAKKFSQKIVVMDTTALRDLHMGHPVSAFRGAMEAKSLLASVRDNIRI